MALIFGIPSFAALFVLGEPLGAVLFGYAAVGPPLKDSGVWYDHFRPHSIVHRGFAGNGGHVYSGAQPVFRCGS